MPVIIAGFSPSNRVPGAYGEIVRGTGGQSAASIPLVLLLVGQATGGNLTVDTEVRQVFSKTDLDTAAQAGSELACMGYDVLDTPEASTVPLFIASPKAPTGTAATATIAIGGTWTTAGSLIVRIGGKPITLSVSGTDTASIVATNLAALINGAYQGRLPLSATAATSNVTINSKTLNARANQNIVFLDTTQAPSGLTANITGPTWVTATTYALNSYVAPVTYNGFYFKATAITGTGTSGATEPVWPTTIGTTVIDNSGANQITWTCWGKIVARGQTSGVTLGGATGAETYTNLLATILNRQFDTIALAANDATSLGAWKAQVDGQEGAPANILQQVVVASNDTLTSAQSIAQTTLNDALFEVLWQLNGETHPSRVAAAFAAVRTSVEQSDPAAAAQYNFRALPATVAAQSQSADWPSLPTLVSALNNSTSPITNTGDGVARLVRSITTKSLTGSNPDYTSFDTSAGRCPQFVLKDLKLLWSNKFAQANLRVQDNPGANDPQPASGVAYPNLWGGTVYARMKDYQAGRAPGTCPPIVINVQPQDTQANLDSTNPTTPRIMLEQTTHVAPNNAQVGCSIRTA